MVNPSQGCNFALRYMTSRQPKRKYQIMGRAITIILSQSLSRSALSIAHTSVAIGPERLQGDLYCLHFCVAWIAPVIASTLWLSQLLYQQREITNSAHDFSGPSPAIPSLFQSTTHFPAKSQHPRVFSAKSRCDVQLYFDDNFLKQPSTFRHLIWNPFF